MPEAVRTYFVMQSPASLLPAQSMAPDARVERLGACTPAFYRWLYAEVGGPYRWTDRTPWTDAQIRAHLARVSISVWLLSVVASPAGYFELEHHEDGSVEIAYFGLLQEFVGRGLGGWLLTRAVEEAWALGASRVWLHTCTFDHPAAAPNYTARGFTVDREERYQVPNL